MKILLIGSTGTIGNAIQAQLSAQHEVIGASHKDPQHALDLAVPASIRALLERLGPLDAIVSAAGLAPFTALHDAQDTDFELGLRNKLMGQVNLVRIGMDYLRDGGSITLTTGILAQQPMPGSAIVSLVNAGLEGFVRAAALEAPRGLRINAVSPVFVSETAAAMGMDTSHTLSAADTAQAYVAALTGDMHGEVLDARRYAA